MRPLAIALLALALPLLGGCGGSAESADERQARMQATREPAETASGDLRLQASIAPTASLGDAILRQYGVRPAPRTLLLLVGVQRVDEGGQTTPLSAQIRADMRDLRGVRSDIALREVRNGGFIDYVGEARVSPPDTLGFTIRAETGDGTPLELRFNRDVFR